MVKLKSILSSSRAYEFPPDGIRLTVLALPGVGSAVQEAFQFQVAGVASPPSTFGPVPPTAPPGAIFQLGVFRDEGGHEIQVRELYVESRRVVISVAGPSAAISAVWDEFGKVLEPFRAPDGGAILGEPYRERDFSDLSIQLNITPDALVSPDWLEASQEALKGTTTKSTSIFVPALHAILWKQGEEYPGDYPIGAVGQRNLWTLALRAGAVVGESCEFYSAAPLDSDSHLAYLKRLESALASPSTTSRRARGSRKKP